MADETRGAERDARHSAENGAPLYLAGHGFTPGKFSGACRVMLARYPCNYTREQHDPALPPVDVDVFGYRRGRVIPPGSCPTPGCPGDARYAAPGRNHVEGCTYPIPPAPPDPSPTQDTEGER